MKIVIRTIILFALALAALPLSAQKSTYKRANYLRDIRTNIKNEAYDKAVSIIDEAVAKYPGEAGKDAEFYFLRTESMRNLMLQEAKKMYLKQSQDTTRYFSFIYGIYRDGTHCDSLASIPDAKGKVRNPYHKTLTGYFTSNLKALYNGCKYAYSKNQYSEAIDYASMYIAQDGENKVSAATIAVLAGFATSRHDIVDRHITLALGDSTIRTQLYEIAARSYEAMGNKDKQLQTLRQGWQTNPKHEYFYLTLIDIYNSHNDYAAALELTKQQLATDSTNRDLWFIRGKSEMFLDRDDEALNSFHTATTLLSRDASSFSAIGNIFLKRSQELYNTLPSLPLKEQAAAKLSLRNIQTKAKEAFEAARKFNPTDKSLWLTGLKEIYYKLNMGKELRALE